MPKGFNNKLLITSCKLVPSLFNYLCNQILHSTTTTRFVRGISWRFRLFFALESSTSWLRISRSKHLNGLLTDTSRGYTRQVHPSGIKDGRMSFEHSVDRTSWVELIEWNLATSRARSLSLRGSTGTSIWLIQSIKSSEFVLRRS